MEFDIAYYKQLLDHLAEAVIFTDRDRRILYWNHAAEQLTGYSADDVLGSFCHDGLLGHVDGDDCALCSGNCPLSRAMQQRRTIAERALLSHREGHRIPVNIKSSPVFDPRGDLVGAIEIFDDASEQVELEELNLGLRKLIRIDALTRLPNRRAFLDTLHKEYLRFARYGSLFSVVMVDIDNFRDINDNLGRATGNRALQWIAGQLRGSFRKADLISCWSGQRFAVLLPNAGARAAEKAAEKIRRQLAGQLCPETGSYITASFGLTEISRHDAIERLLKRAERALADAKEKGKNRVVRM